MVPLIGIMIGSYIIIRMVSFISRKGQQEENNLIKIMAAIEIMFVLFCIIQLFTTSADMSSMLNY